MPKKKLEHKKLPPDMMSLRVMTRSFRDVQGQRIMTGHRIKQLVNNKIMTKDEAEEIYEQTLGYLEQAEKELDKKVKRIVRKHQVWEWGKHVKGIGERLCGGIMGEFGDIALFPSAGHVWAYCGLKVIKVCPRCGNDRIKIDDGTATCKCGFVGRPIGRAQHRMKGRKNTCNSSLKTLARLTAECLIKRPNPYREAYLNYKQDIIDREVQNGKLIWQKSATGVVTVAHGDASEGLQPINYVCSNDKCKRVDRSGGAAGAPPKCGKCGSDLKETSAYSAIEWTLGRINNMALRWLAKLFLYHLWVVWRRAEGLPDTDELAMKYLGHAEDKDPWAFADQRKRVKV